MVVAGCVAQAEGGEILRRQPAVDLVVGPQNYHRLPELLRERRAARGVVDTDFPVEDKFDHLPAERAGRRSARAASRAFVTVQEGCDKFCSFCVVPYTRGGEVSRPVAQDARGDRAAGGGRRREVTLIGQNVNAYHGQGADGRALDLAELLGAAADDPRRPAAALCDLAPQRHGRGADPRPSRHSRSGALSAPADPVGLGSHFGGDEPAPHRRTTISTSSRVRAARGPTSRSPRISSSAFPARATPISRRRLRWCARSASPPPTPSNIRRGPAPRRRTRTTRSTRRRKVDAARRTVRAARGAAAGLQSRARRAHVSTFFSKSRAGMPVRSSAARPICSRSTPRAMRSLIGAMAEVEIIGVGPNSLIGRLVAQTFT